MSSETHEIAKHIARVLSNYGPIINVSVDGTRCTAIVRFRHISAAESAYKASREFIPSASNGR